MIKNSFWKNASIMAFAEFFLKIKALIMLPLITKYLGPINYGVWSQVMVIVSLLSPLVFCGMENSLARFLPGQSIERQRREFTGWFLFGIVSSILMLGIVCALSYPFSELFFGTKKEYPLFVVLAGFNIVTTSLLSGIRYWFRVQSNVWFLFTITIIQNLLQMLVLISVLIWNQGIYELILWSLIVDVMLIVLYLGYMYKKKVFSVPSLAWLKPYLRFGVVFLPAGYAVWVLNSIDRVFLAQYHSLSDIGIYSISFTIGYTLIQVVVNPIWSLFPTKAAEFYNLHKIAELNNLLNQSIKLICWLIVPSIFGLIIVGDLVLKLLSTQAFARGYLVVPIILAGYLFSMLSAYFEVMLTLKNKPYLSVIFTVIACLMNIFFNFLLIPKFSYLGAAVATMLSFAIQLNLSTFYARGEETIKFNKKPIIKIFISSFLMFLMTCFLRKMSIDLNGIWEIFFLVSFGITVYLILTH
ncbi:MAG TPA: oligosaccharide flippase family protein, partial [Flavobacterium sp.]|nr:oligosaccharide flippase family protein [Flavobacterium sp.]